MAHNVGVAALYRVGRPTLYTDELAERICSDLRSGKTLLEVSESEDMPELATIYVWINQEEAPPETSKFPELYARARRVWIDREADNILQIADDARNDWMDRQIGEDTIRVVDHEHVQRSKLRIDARKWLLSKLRPDQFGDRLAHQMLDEQGKPAKAGITIIVDGAPSGSAE